MKHNYYKNYLVNFLNYLLFYFSFTIYFLVYIFNKVIEYCQLNFFSFLKYPHPSHYFNFEYFFIIYLYCLVIYLINYAKIFKLFFIYFILISKKQFPCFLLEIFNNSISVYTLNFKINHCLLSYYFRYIVYFILKILKYFYVSIIIILNYFKYRTNYL